MKTILENVEETLDAEITLLFNNAIDKLGKVDEQAKEKKKQIITDLARNLEGKIQTDTISIEIVNQLRGNVSERFIHECIEVKYKQKVRVDNARKQKHQKKERKIIDKLAVLPPLNLEKDEDEEKNKEVIIIDVDGRTSLQEDGDEPSITTDASTTTGRIVVPASNEQDQEQQLKSKITPI